MLLIYSCQAPAPDAATDDAGGGPETGGGEDSKGDHPRIGSHHPLLILTFQSYFNKREHFSPHFFLFFPFRFRSKHIWISAKHFFQSPTLFLTLIRPH